MKKSLTSVIGMFVVLIISFSVNALFIESTKILASGSTPLAFVGTSIDVSGDTLVAGAPNDSAFNISAGAAYVFERNQGGAENWGQIRQLAGSDTTAGDGFGRSVAIDGDIIVVAASDKAVYVFERNQGGADNWGQVARLVGSGIAANDLFGASVAIDGTTVVIGAYNDENGAIRSGSAYIFERDGGGNWLETQRLSVNGLLNSRFGWEVGISQNTVVVSAAFDSTLASQTGTVYVFDRNQGGADNWGQVAQLSNPTPGSGDQYGYAMDIHGDNLIIGALNSTENGISRAGAAYIYNRNQGGTDNWGFTTQLTPSDSDTSDLFGIDVSIDGSNALVGASGTDSTSYIGEAYFFSQNVGGVNNWGETQFVTATVPDSEDLFGRSVRLQGNTAFISAPKDDDNNIDEGAVYVFENLIATVTITATDNLAAENPVDNGQYTVDLGTVNNTGSAITVNYSVTGMATSGSDYIALSGSISIPNGQQTGTIDLIPLDDAVVDPAETVVVTLTSTDNTSFVVDTTPATVTINDDESVSTSIPSDNSTGLAGDDRNQDPQIDIFDPAISKIGFLLPGQTGVPGERVEWGITVTNIGSIIGYDIVVTDTLNDSLRIDNVEASGGDVTINGQIITVTYPVLNVGSTFQIFILTTVLEGIEVENTVCIDATNQSTEKCAAAYVVSQLPNTGESPNWRSRLTVIIGLLILIIGSTCSLAYRLRLNMRQDF